MRILIVEDDAALASFIRKGLEAEYHAVDVAVEGNHGRSMAVEFDYDLVVLDLNLPGADGLSVLKSLRQRKANLPVMILTCGLPGCRGGRLSGEAVFLSGVGGAGAGVAASQPSAVRVGAYGPRSLPGPGRTQGSAGRAPD